MTLLLVVLLLSVMITISAGIFSVVFGELRISGEITDSFTALYAADQGIELMHFCDRMPNSGCDPCQGQPQDSCTYGPVTTALPNGACMTVQLSRAGQQTTVISTGEYRCATPDLSVKRSFQSFYTKEVAP